MSTTYEEFMRRLVAAMSVPVATGDGAKVIPFDPEKRKTRMERQAKRAWQIKRRRAQERKIANDRIVKQMNLRGDKK